MRRPDLETLYSINADGSRNFLHPADVRGRWQTRRNLVHAALIAVYLLLPWLRVGGRPAVHFDLPGRAAYLFGRSFTNQDFYLVFFLVTGMGFGLFVVTALVGRVWCGFACPQTVFLESVFRRVERWIEGPRERRIRRNAGPATLDKSVRKGLKHLLFLGMSAGIAHAFLAYFIPVEQLAGLLRSGPEGHWAAFGWTVFWTAALYFDHAWFREQTCLVVCPYGRFQSVLVDADTVLIGYDQRRGEPRGRKGGEGGDCVDCFRCVVVCPTGIDIRRGLQMECVGCTNCIDACDEVMIRLGRPRGLIRYDSRRGFGGERRRGWLRPRVLLYGALGALGLGVFGFVASGRADFEARVLRSAGMPYVLEGGRIRNLYTLHLQNKTDAAVEYRISPPSGEALEIIIAQPRVAIPGMGDAEVPVFAFLPLEAYEHPFPLRFRVKPVAGGEEQELEVTFRGP